MTLAKPFEIERMGDTIILNLRKGPRDSMLEHSRGDTARLLELLAKTGTANIIIDCHDIDFLRSTALHFFVLLSKRVRRQGGQLVFCNVSSKARRILHATKLDQLWKTVNTLSEAICEVA